MKEVRVKQRRTWGIGHKAVVALLAMVSILAGALLLPRLLRPAAPLPSPLPDSTIRLFTSEEEKIASFTVSPTGEGPYTIRRDGNQFVVDGQPGFDLSPDAIRAMLDVLIYFEAADVVGSTETDGLNPVDYGLGEDALYVSVALADGRTFGFKIGNRMLTHTPLDYGMVQGDSTIYALNIDIKQTFDQRLGWLHTLPNINFTPELMDSLQVTGEQDLHIRRLTDGLWEMEKPFRYPVSVEKMRGMFDAIKKMRFAAYVSPADDEHLAQYGLQEPRLTVAFHLAESVITSQAASGAEPISQHVGEQSIRIEIGNPVPGVGFYCRYLDTIYQASDLSMGFLDIKEPETFLSSLPLYIPLSALSHVVISGESGSSSVYDISLVEEILPNNEIARDGQGNILYRYHIVSDGKEIMEDKFAALYGTLMSIRATGNISETYEPGGVPLLSIRLEGDGVERSAVFYPYDALHAAIGVNGTFVHYADLASIKEAINQFRALAD